MNAHDLQLTALDSSYLDVETTKTPMHVACLIFVDARPLLDSRGRVRTRMIRNHVAQTWEHLEIMNLRLRGGQGAVPPYRWEHSSEDMADLIQLSRVGGRGTDRDVLNRCVELLAAPLPRDWPLWRLHILSGISRKRLGILLQVHHSLTDGEGGVVMLRALMAGVGPEPGHAKRKPQLELQPVLRRTAASVLGAAETLLKVAEGAAFLATTTRLRPSTSLNGPVTAARRLDAQTVALEEVRRVARALKVTVNDVMLSAVAGSLGTVLGERGDPVSGMVLEAMVPVSTRAPGAADDVGNHTSVLQVPLPIGMVDAVERTRAINQATKRRKNHHIADAIASIEALATEIRIPFQHGLAKLALDHQPLVNLVVTNVPGPQERLRFLDAEVLKVMAFLPLAHDLPLAIALCSYNADLVIGVQSDPNICSDAPTVVKEIVAQLRLLSTLTGPTL